MSWLSGPSELIAGGWLASKYAGHGVRGDAVPSTGTHGPSPIYNDLSLPDDAAKEYRWRIETPPSAGVFSAFEDGSFTLIGAADGAYSFTYRLWQDGVDLGTATGTITIGAVIPTDALWLDATGKLSVSGTAGANRRMYLMPDGSLTASASAVGGGRAMRMNSAGSYVT